MASGRARFSNKQNVSFYLLRWLGGKANWLAPAGVNQAFCMCESGILKV